MLTSLCDEHCEHFWYRVFNWIKKKLLRFYELITGRKNDPWEQATLSYEKGDLVVVSGRQLLSRFFSNDWRSV